MKASQMEQDSIIISRYSPLAYNYPKLAGHIGPDGKQVFYRLVLTQDVIDSYPVLNG